MSRGLPNVPRIFLSYARTDGHQLAAQLRQMLEPSFSLYQDLVNLEGGKDWWDQLKKAIDEVEYLVLVITPNSLKSEYVGKEWSYARQKGLCVIPVFEGPEPDFAALPHKWMRDAHFINIGIPEQWTVFVNQLSRRCEVARVPFMAEDLPADYVERLGEFNRLKTLILQPDKSSPVSIVAAKGAGGYGKTTLAKALCHDPDIQQVFHDGILWVTLGKVPGDLTTHVVNLIETLTGEKPGFSDVNAASTRLAELLSDNDLLLVIDDVWKPGHAAPFLRGGKNCVRLITTRDSATLPTESRNTQVDAMQTGEALALLSKNLPSAPPQLGALAKKLGEWPLLLKLVNGILVRRTKDARQPLKDAIAFVSRQGLNAVDPEVIAKTLSISIEQLRPDERDRFAQLAIFPEDTPILMAVIEQLWSTDSDDTEQLCERLFELSLLLNLDLGARELRIHDVIRAWLRKENQGMLPAWNTALIDQQPYTWTDRPYHLNEAGRHDELRTLLFNFDWLQTKLNATNVNALLQDFDYLPHIAKRLQSAIRLAAHVLGQDKKQLAPQLIGRMSENDSAEIQAMLSQARQWPGDCWFCPKTSSLTVPGGPLLRTFTGHTDSVTAVAVTSDGRRVVSASHDRTLKVWDLDGGAELRTLVGHTRSVNALEVTPDGRRAVSTSHDGTLKIWDLDSGVEVCTLGGHTDSVNAVAAKARRAVSASSDKTLKVWDLDSGAELLTLSGHTGSVNAVALTPDGHYAISASADNTLKIWDLDSGAVVRTLTGHFSSVTAVAITPDGGRAVSGSSDQTLKVWDLEGGANLHSLTGHTGRVVAVAVTTDGRCAISASTDKTLKVWDLESGGELHSLEGHTDTVNDVAVTPNGYRAISASGDKTLKLWDLDRVGEIGARSGHTKSITALEVTADGLRAVSASSDRTLKVWDLDSAAELRTLSGHTNWVIAVALTADGRRAVSASHDRTLKVWDLDSGAELRTLSGHAHSVDAVAVTADGHRVILASWDPTLTIWDLDSGAELRTLSGHTNWVTAVALMPDGRRMVSASRDKTLRIWDLDSGAELRTLSGHTNWVTSVTVTPDGRLAVSGSRDGTLKVWSLDGGSEPRTLTGHAGSIDALTVMSNGYRAVSASQDNTLKLWDIATGQVLATFIGDSAMTACAVSADNRTFVAGEASGRIHFLTLIEPTP